MKLRIIFIVLCVGLIDIYISKRIKHDYEHQKQAATRTKQLLISELKRS